MATVMGVQHRPERKGAVPQDAQKVRQPLKRATGTSSETGARGQIEFPPRLARPRQSRLAILRGVPDVQAIDVLLYRNGFSAAC